MVLQGGFKDVVSSWRANSQTLSDDAATDQLINLYAWDLDETLILLKALQMGRLLGILKASRFMKKIENYNQPYISALYEHDDGKDLNMILRLTGLVLLMMIFIRESLHIGSVMSEISMQRQVVIRARNLRNGVQFIPAKAFKACKLYYTNGSEIILMLNPDLDVSSLNISNAEQCMEACLRHFRTTLYLRTFVLPQL